MGRITVTHHTRPEVCKYCSTDESSEDTFHSTQMGPVDPDLVVQDVLAELDTGGNDSESLVSKNEGDNEDEGVNVKGYDCQSTCTGKNSTEVEEIEHELVEENVVDDSKVENAEDVCEEETEILCSDDGQSDGEEEQCSRMVVDDVKDDGDMNIPVP